MASSQNPNLSAKSSEKVELPYLDWRLNPAVLAFNEIDPAKSSPYVATFEYIMLGQTKYALHILLGKGAFGEVYLAQDCQTQEWVAFKKVKIDLSRCDLHRAELGNEIAGLKIANMYIASSDVTLATEVHLVMKLVEGHELYEALVVDGDNDKCSPQFFSTVQRLYLAKQVLKQAADLHKGKADLVRGVSKDKRQLIMHRDIKTNNFMFYPAKHSVRLVDFGLAGIAEHVNAVADNKWTHAATSPGMSVNDERIGTSMFVAPEHMYYELNTGYVSDERTEMYALGMTLAELFELQDEVVQTLKSGRKILRYNILDSSEYANSNVVAFIKRMTASLAGERPTVTEAYAFFNREFANESAKEDCGLNVCLLSVSEFIGLSRGDRDDLIQEIIDKRIIAIVLQGDENTTKKDYYQVRYQLIKAGIINVAAFMMKGDDQKEIIRAVKETYDLQFASVHTAVYTSVNGELCDHFQVSLNLLIDDISEKIIRFVTCQHDQTLVDQLRRMLDRRSRDIDLRVLITILETFYRGSICIDRSFINASPKMLTPDEINNTPDDYAMPRALGVLLSHAYEAIDYLHKLGDHKKRFVDVARIDSNADIQNAGFLNAFMADVQVASAPVSEFRLNGV